jgi:hypothetical protein
VFESETDDPPNRLSDFGLPESEAFTVHGEIERWGLFASGTHRARGWALVALRVIVIGTVLLLGAGVLIGLVNHSFGGSPTPPVPTAPTGP